MTLTFRMKVSLVFRRFLTRHPYILDLYSTSPLFGFLQIVQLNRSRVIEKRKYSKEKHSELSQRTCLESRWDVWRRRGRRGEKIILSVLSPSRKPTKTGLSILCIGNALFLVRCDASNGQRIAPSQGITCLHLDQYSMQCIVDNVVIVQPFPENL